MIHRTTNTDLGVTAEGQYEQVQDLYFLRSWRVISTYQGRTHTGRWHKVHKNQKKDIGALKLVRFTAPIG